MAFAPPRNALELLPRPELVGRMATGFEGQIVLLEAPPGFGKTETMAASYRLAARRQREAHWLTLSPGMDAAAIAQALARAVAAPDPSPASVLATLSAREGEVELYLDDAERLSPPGADPAVGAEALHWLIGAAPDNLRIALAGRQLPPLRLSRLRQRGLVSRIGPSDLAFSRGEMAQILQHWLPGDETEAAIQSFAGWPALVRLARMELESGLAPAARRALIEGSARVFDEFLAEDVLPSLQDGARAILHSVYGLDSFTPHIVAELAGAPSDSETIRRLDGLFPLILPEHQKAGWYRLSPVASAFLGGARNHESAEARRARHIRASRLFAEEGSLEKSVLHASLAGDQDLIVRTIEKAGGVNLFLRAGYSVLRAILQAVPHDVVVATPSLRLCRCVMLAKSGRIAEARAAVDSLVADTAGETDPDWTGPLRHIDSLVAVYEDHGIDAVGITELRAVARAEAQENTWKQGWIYNHLTIAHTRAGDLEEAMHCALRALAAYQEERASYPQIFMQIHIAYIHCRAGRPDRAQDHIGQALGMIRSRHWGDRNLQAIAHVVLARIRYLQGALPEARQLLEPALPVMARGEGWVDFYADGYATLARARMALEGWTEAREVLAEAEELADARELGRLRLWISIQRAGLLLRDGQIGPARALAAQWPDPEDPAPWATPRERNAAALMRARIRLRGGEGEGGGTGEGETGDPGLFDALRRLSDRLRAEGAEAALLPAALMRAEAAARRHLNAEALAALEEAVALARHGDQVQPYRDEGKAFAEEIRRLLRRAGIGGLSRAAVEYLSRVAPQPLRKGHASLLISRREAQILTLLAEGLPNKAIARQIGISEPTVKFHLKNLYAKLGVGRRPLAVAAARNLGLLPRAH
ncbi:LuxR C-terminal-related transcriptional regulator [Pseudogemmobacter sonorensis]|uniref:LuxR C-terminal-related transcriptional regulator n=1 Tax=Pseudogemmobacter sonorensis TaxID=2989681 RepID=UPI0036CCE0E5